MYKCSLAREQSVHILTPFEQSTMRCFVIIIHVVFNTALSYLSLMSTKSPRQHKYLKTEFSKWLWHPWLIRCLTVLFVIHDLEPKCCGESRNPRSVGVPLNVSHIGLILLSCHFKVESSTFFVTRIDTIHCERIFVLVVWFDVQSILWQYNYIITV